MLLVVFLAFMLVGTLSNLILESLEKLGHTAKRTEVGN